MRHIIVETADADFAGRHETMAEGAIGRLDAIEREIDDLRLFRLRAEGRDNAVQRPDPAQRLGRSRGRAPAHRLRPGKALQNIGKDFRQQLRGAAALMLDDGDIEFALLRLDFDLGVRDRGEARAFDESLNGGIGRADARAFLDFAAVLLPLGQSGDMEREPARRRKARGAFEGKPLRMQGFADEPAQIVRRLPLHAGGNFFGEKFEEEVRHVPPPASVFSHALPQALANSRTRRM